MIQERKYRSHVDLLKNLKNCCRETFAVGFKYTTESNRKCHQMGWILVLIVSFSGVFFHCYTLTVTYFSYRVLNSVSHEYVDDDFFPSVTICNSQPVSDVSYRRHVNTSDMYNGKYTYGLLKDVKLFSSVGRELSKKIGHAFGNMILYCKFKDTNDCKTKMEYCRIYQSTRSFNCYTFTPNHTFDNFSDEEMKLSLILYREQEDENNNHKSYVFSHTLDSKNLVKFTIHERGEMPDTLFKSVFVQTGIKMSVILTGKIQFKAFGFTKVNDSKVCLISG